jgi:hypothetical protein
MILPMFLINGALVMTNDLQDILHNNPAIKGLDEDTLAVAKGSYGSNTKRISIRGKNFHKVVNGQEIATIEDNEIHVIIVKMAHTAARTFYAEAYVEGKNVSPTCWSNDSRVPDSEVPSPQAKSCDSCQFSIRGSGLTGTGSACRLSWRIAVVLANDPSGDVMQVVLPATSAFGKEDLGKWRFRPYIQMLANNSVSAGNVVTKMEFDLKASIPKLYFSPVAAVNTNHTEILKKQAKSVEAEAAIKMTVVQSDVKKPIFEPILKNDESLTEDIDKLMNKWDIKD